MNLKLANEALRFFLIAEFIVLFPIVFYSESYELIYCAIVTLLVSFFIVYKYIIHRFLTVFFIFYLGIGLLNISDYRGAISVETIRLYWYCISCFVLSSVLISPVGRGNKILTSYTRVRLFDLIMYSHLAIVYVLTIYLYATKGIIIIYQDLRFGIPTSIGYAIRSSLFIPIILMILKDWRFDKSFLIISILAIAPSFLIGSRSTGLLAIVAMMLLYVAMNVGNTVKRVNLTKIAVWGAVLSFGMLGGGFYLRRAFSPDLLTGPDMIDIYFGGNHSLYIYILLPFHQGFNETAALTSRIIDYGIVNTFSSTALFFADFNNLLGTSNISAAQHFGDEIGRVGDGGLTPGVIGGLFMDFSYGTVYVFAIFGIIYALLAEISKYNKCALCLVCIFVTQFMHLFHRGFFKPEYITIFLIAFFYMLFLVKADENKF